MCLNQTPGETNHKGRDTTSMEKTEGQTPYQAPRTQGIPTGKTRLYNIWL